MSVNALRLETIADENGQPVAVIVPLQFRRKVERMPPEGISSAAKASRPIGLAKGEFSVPPSFFEPLPDELLDAFEGRGAP